LTPVDPEVLAAETWLRKPVNERGAPPDVNFSRDSASRMIAMAWAEVEKSRAVTANEELSAKKNHGRGNIR